MGLRSLLGLRHLPSPYSPSSLCPPSCGRLAFHIQLPYSFLHLPYVESAIRFTHRKDFCGNCSLYPNSTQEVLGCRAVGWALYHLTLCRDHDVSAEGPGGQP